MVRTHQDRTCAIAYNGEIYNTEELIPELTRAGYTFESSSDTEVFSMPTCTTAQTSSCA